MSNKPITVSDHAVLRWLERECGVDIEAVRTAIGDCCERGIGVGATTIKIGKVKFIVVDSKIVTCLIKSHRKRKPRQVAKR